MVAMETGSNFKFGYFTWSLLILSLVHLTAGFGEEKQSFSGTEPSFLSQNVDSPDHPYFSILKNHFESDMKDGKIKTNNKEERLHKDKDKLEHLLLEPTITRKGRGKKGDKKMQMMYLGLMYIKSVIHMVMMAIGQVLQFKSVVISLVSVLIQVAQFVMMLRQKPSVKPPPPAPYHSKLAPVEPSWTPPYEHTSSEIVEDGGLGSYAGYRYDGNNVPPHSPDIAHSYTYGPSLRH